MSNSAYYRFSIGQVMGLIAGLALIWAGFTTPNLVPFIFWVLLPVGLVIIVPVLVINHLIDGSFGVRCPNCGDPALQRRTIASFGSRFYLCNACGVRCQRGAFGNWSDASDPKYDNRFRKKPCDDPWSAPPGLEDEDLIYSKTHGNLVRNKRRRSPENPNGPGLE